MKNLQEIKKALGTGYEFHAAMPPQKVKEILTRRNETFADEVIYVLNAGYVNIEMTLFLSSKGLTAGYDCCIKDRELGGDWISYDSIPDVVNFNVKDMEAEMFRVLDSFVTKHNLSYTECNSPDLKSEKDKA